MNLNSFLQNFDEQKKEIINVKSFSQVAISKTKINNINTSSNEISIQRKNFNNNKFYVEIVFE